MLVNPQFSAAQKREVTTYLVTPRDRGSLHCSIQQAIDKADPYSRIVLASGQYFESVTLQQPLEIVGEDGSEMPEVSARGVCLSLLGDVETYFENVKFTTKTAQFASKAAARSSATQTSVRITGGRPTFTKCAMTSCFVGGDAVPTMKNCTINGNVNGSGLTVAENAAGEFIDNTISNHLPYAVHVKSRQAPLFQGNTIFQDPKFRHQLPSDQYVERQGGAVLVSQDSIDSDDVTRSIAPRFINNRIGDEIAVMPFATTTFEALTHPNVALNGDFEQFYTERRTVVVDNGCSPFFDDNTITGGHIGVTLGTGSSGTFTNNSISHSSVIGIVGGALSTTVVRFNTISHCATGIFAQNTSATLTQNSVKENIGSGLMLLIGTDDKFHMEGNSFVGNDVGICVRPSCTPNRLKGLDRRVDGGNAGEALLEKNYICLNKSAGIVVCGEGYTVTLRDIEVGANGKYGAYCSYGASPIFVNVRFERGTVGLLFERTANPSVENCQFTGQTEAAIVSQDRGLGRIVDNSITGFAKYGILVDDGGAPFVKKNKLASSSGIGIAVIHGGAGYFCENTVELMTTGLSISSFGDPVFTDNTVSSCTEMGIHIFDEGCGTITSNVVSACAVGVGCSLGGECVVRANTIKGCSRFGLISSEGSRLLVEKNTFDSNIGGNILLEGHDCLTTITRNVIMGSAGFGVRSCRGAGGVVSFNTCSGNRDGGIGSDSHGNTLFEHNICKNERGPGIVVKPSGKGMFVGNRVEGGEGHGAELYPQSAAEIVDGVFCGNHQSGILLHNACGGHVKRCLIEGNRQSGVEFNSISNISNTVLDALTIRGNAGEGVRLLDHCALKMISSSITHHEIGVFLQCTGPAVFEHCTIEHNVMGARFEKGGVASIVSCTFRSQGDADVCFATDGSGFVKNCVLGDKSDVAILGSYGGGGEVVGCTISATISAGVKLLKNSFTVVRNTTIEGCAKFGVLCEGMCLGTVRECSVRACTEGNVKLLPQASPSIVNCTVELSKTSGLIIESRNGRIEGNTVQGNEEHGILFFEPNSTKDSQESRQQSSATSRRRSVARRASKVVEAQLDEGTAPACDIICTMNVVKKNGGAGIFFSNGTTADLYDNDIHMNAEGGIVVGSACTPTIGKGNRIHRNSESGIVLRSHSSATVANASVFHNDPCNVDLQVRSSGCLEDCDISDAAVDGIRAVESVAQIRRCKISACAQGCGMVLLGANKHMQVMDCEFFSNGVGVSADVAGACARFVSNTFRHNILCGVRLENGGCPDLVDNVFENGTLGVVLHDGAGGTLTNNRFVKNAEGLAVTGTGIATVCRENSFIENDKGIVLRQTDSSFVVENSTFGPSESAGISCEDGAKGAVRDNKFHGGQRGVLVTASASPTISSNCFEQCKCGVDMVGRSTPRVEKNLMSFCDVGCRSSTVATAGVVVTANVFYACTTAGFLTEKQSTPVVSRNIFTDCSAGQNSCGVLCTEGGAGTFSENDFHNNGFAVIGSSNGCGDFSRCMFHDNRYGCLMEQSARTSFERCTFFNNSVGDVLSRNGGSPSFRNCFFSKGQSGAIQLTHGGAGSFVANMFRDCQTAFVIEDCGPAVVSNNYITNCPVGVVMRRAVSRGLSFLRNVISSCDVGIHGAAGGGATVSQNFITLGEVGSLIEKRSQLKLTHNTFLKLSKTGILIKGNGNALVANNLVQDCSSSGITISIPIADRAGGTAESDITPTLILENYCVGSRNNVQVMSGEVTLRKNHVQRGDFGLTVLPDARATIDGNVVYDGMRASFTLGSRHCTITNNLFYSLNDGGAFEVSHDASPILSKDNSVYNSCSCKMAPPSSSAPARQVDVEAYRAKDVLGSLQASLVSIHTTEAPDCGHCGCSAIPGSHERRAAAASASAKDESFDLPTGGLEAKRSAALLKVSSTAALLRVRRKSSLTEGDALARSTSITDALTPVPPPVGTPTAAATQKGSATFRRQSTSSKR